MKKLITLLAFVFTISSALPFASFANDLWQDSISAQRGGSYTPSYPSRDHDRYRPNRPSRPGWDGDRWRRGGGQVSCTVGDAGWEEHWGGHGSCESCLAKHGSCTETCSTTSYICTASGTDQNGITETFEGYASSEFEARSEATDRCYYAGLRSCSVSFCRNDSQVVSRKSCR